MDPEDSADRAAIRELELDEESEPNVCMAWESEGRRVLLGMA